MEKIKFERIIEVVKKVILVMLFAVVSSQIHLEFSENLEANAFLFGFAIAIGILCVTLKNKFLRMLPWILIGTYACYSFLQNLSFIFNI